MRRLLALLRRGRERLVGGFLADPTHISLGLLGIAVAFGLIAAAEQPEAVGPLPPFLLYGWAAGLILAGLGKITGPYLICYPQHEDLARGILLGASILAATCWLTIAVGLLFLGPGASLGVLQAFALGVGAAGRSWAIVRNTRVIEQHVERGGTDT